MTERSCWSHHKRQKTRLCFPGGRQSGRTLYKAISRNKHTWNVKRGGDETQSAFYRRWVEHSSWYFRQSSFLRSNLYILHSSLRKCICINAMIIIIHYNISHL